MAKERDILNEIEKLTQDDFYDGGWRDNQTFLAHIKLPKVLQELLETADHWLICEYWVDDDSYHYQTGFKQEGESDDEIMYYEPILNLNQNPHLNQLVANHERF